MTGGISSTDLGNFVQLNYLSDTWIWNAAGMTWSEVKTPNSYPAPGPCAYDSAHGQLVLFTAAGYFPGQINQTWLFDGTDWTQASPKNMPSPRSGFSLAYDPAHGQVVLFGGSGEGQDALAETWVWDGANWTQMNPKTSPPGRHDHAMAYDAVHGQMVIFGGEIINTATFTATVFADTWTWDGTNWTKQSPVSAPSPRVDYAMAFDAAHGHMVLFGGLDQSSNSLGDTWFWDGGNWNQQSPATSPAAEAGAGMAFDAAHSTAVLFGGVNAQLAYLNSTSLWSEGAATVTQPVVTSVIGASGFGGFPLVAPGSWIEIYGYDLASVTREWAATDFNGNNAPTSLNNVQVTIGGQPAYVEYISSGGPGQINAQVPANITPGTVQPLIVKNGGAAGVAFSVNVAGNAPGLLAPSSFLISSNQYVVALFSDGATYVLPAGAIPGVASRPAHPGDLIVLYGVGFGSVTPDTPPGEIASQSNQLAQTFKMSIGGAPAPLRYWGLASGYVGLYQFNVEVPQISDNSLAPVTFSLGGTPGTQTLYLAVHQ